MQTTTRIFLNLKKRERSWNDDDVDLCVFRFYPDLENDENIYISRWQHIPMFIVFSPKREFKKKKQKKRKKKNCVVSHLISLWWWFVVKACGCLLSTVERCSDIVSSSGNVDAVCHDATHVGEKKMKMAGIFLCEMMEGESLGTFVFAADDMIPVVVSFVDTYSLETFAFVWKFLWYQSCNFCIGKHVAKNLIEMDDEFISFSIYNGDVFIFFIFLN